MTTSRTNDAVLVTGATGNTGRKTVELLPGGIMSGPLSTRRTSVPRNLPPSGQR
jgi:hypothetical protein